MKLLNKFLEDKLNLDPSEFQSEFILFEKLILEWNKKINVISRKSESIEDHILSSIFFLTKYKFDNIKNVADIGSGGGFPGIPLKILFPEINFTLIDSIRKKTEVQKNIISEMSLKKIHSVCGRAEEVSAHTGFRKKYDTVISKAVAPLDKLFLWGRNFLNKSGEMICIKGGDIDEELSSLNKMKYKFDLKVIKFDLETPYNIEDKKIVIIKEIK